MEDHHRQSLQGRFFHKDNSLKLPLFRLTNDCALFSELNDALNSSIFVDDKLSASGGFEFLLWQSGIECNQHSNYLFSLKVCLI